MNDAATSGDLESRLRELGARRYHNLHPFHRMLHGGQCTKAQVQAWALNRYYYQAMVPLKDASLIGRCEDVALRREWRKRLEDHDGDENRPGGIERWLKLTDGLGLDRDDVISTRLVVAGDAIRSRGLRALRARAQPARGGCLVSDRAVLAADHHRADVGDAGALRLHHAGDHVVFRQASAAGRAGFGLRAANG